MSWIILLGIALILYIFYQIFRIGRLVSVAQKEKKGRVDIASNRLNALLFLLFMVVGLGAFFWYSYTHFDEYTLPVASVHGKATDNLFWITTGITVVAFSLIFIMMFIFVFRYQYHPERKAKYLPDNHYLELAWTIIPAIVLAVLIFAGLRTWNDITSPPSKDAEVIELIGQQFAWTVRYPGVKDNKLGQTNFQLITPLNEFGLDLHDRNTFDDFKALELHLPKGKEIVFHIRAKDVLHSVFLPHFRIKMDAVPGMVTQFKFVATLTTQEMRDKLGNQEFNYEMACAELCGRGHFSMRLPVVVEEPAAYEKWKSEQDSWLKTMLDADSTFIRNIPPDLREFAMIRSGFSKGDERSLEMEKVYTQQTTGTH